MESSKSSNKAIDYFAYFMISVAVLLVGVSLWHMITQHGEQQRFKNETIEKLQTAHEYLCNGLFNDALSKYDDAYDLAFDITDGRTSREFRGSALMCQGICYHNLALLENEEPNLKRALVLLSQSKNLLTKGVNHIYRGRVLLGLGDVHWALSEYNDKKDNLRKTLEYYVNALKVFSESDYPFYDITQSRMRKVRQLLQEY